MQQRKRRLFTLLRPLTPLLMLILTFVPNVKGTVYQQDLPDGEGKEVFMTKCSACHPLEYALAARRTRSGWNGILTEMEDMGAVFSDEEKASIVGYLSKAFGKINVNSAAAEDIASYLGMTSNDGKAIVAYRTEHGKFETLDDLKKVPGVDLKILDEKKDWIAF